MSSAAVFSPVCLVLNIAIILTHFILNKLSPTIYWKSPISILGMSGYVC